MYKFLLYIRRITYIVCMIHSNWFEGVQWGGPNAEFIVFGRASRSVRHVLFRTLIIGVFATERVDVFRYLGTYIDSALSFKAHINKHVVTVYRNLGCLHRWNFSVSKPHLEYFIFFISLVECYFQYFPSVWDIYFPLTFTRAPNCLK